MPYREPLVKDEIYHVMNRGVEKRQIFLKDRDYRRFLDTMTYYQDSEVRQRYSTKSGNLNSPVHDKVKLVEIICFCLMPNHLHLLVRQLVDNGISDYLRKVQNSYAKYFNTKYKRAGHLFQGPYKAVRIISDEQLIHVSRYIHLNPVVVGIAKSPNKYEWSSYNNYLTGKADDFINTGEVLNYFPKPKTKEYDKFVKDQIDYAKSLESIKKLKID